jgi:hypothetical protein
VCQQNPIIIWNLKDHYLVYKIPSLEPILSQLNPLHTYTPCVLTIHFNIIPLLTSIYQYFSFFLTFSDQYYAHISHLPQAFYMSVHLILHDLITLTVFVMVSINHFLILTN